MNPRTRSALAPTYTVDTRITAMSLRGYCRTLSERIDQSPAMRMTRLTTIARTGRRTKRSVIFISAVLRLGGRAVPRLDRVVDEDGRAVPELEGAGGHHLVARLQPRHDRHLVAAGGANLDELLADALVGRAVPPLHVGHDEHGVPIGRVADRRGGEHEDRRGRRRAHVRLDEHPRPEPA